MVFAKNSIGFEDMKSTHGTICGELDQALSL
jgi:hypothetical protein